MFKNCLKNIIRKVKAFTGKNTKRVTVCAVALLAVAAIIIAVCCSGKKIPPAQNGITGAAALPLKENVLSGQELYEFCNIPFFAPRESENASYAVLGETDGVLLISASFTLNGKACYVRAMPYDTSYTLENINELDISGLYQTWTKQKKVKLGNKEAVCRVNKNAGCIIWLDTDNRLVYNLCMEKKASVKNLTALAKAFIAENSR